MPAIFLPAKANALVACAVHDPQLTHCSPSHDDVRPLSPVGAGGSLELEGAHFPRTIGNVERTEGGDLERGKGGNCVGFLYYDVRSSKGS